MNKTAEKKEELEKTLADFRKRFVRNINGFEVVQAFAVEEYENWIMENINQAVEEERKEIAHDLASEADAWWDEGESELGNFLNDYAIKLIQSNNNG